MSKKRANSTNPIKPTQEDRILITEMSKKPKENEDKLHIKKLEVVFKTEAQEKLWKLIDSKEITICAGSAGTGKTHLSILKALELMSRFPTKYKKIIITTPNVESGPGLGYLKGSLNEKMEPYIYSMKYLFYKILGKEKTERMFEREQVQVLAIGFCRGMNFDNCVFILDEAQNCDRPQIRTILTRIGENCKMIISGDTSQIDTGIKFDKTGLYVAIEKLKNIPEIGIFEFADIDIVRNPLISTILERLNGDLK